MTKVLAKERLCGALGVLCLLLCPRAAAQNLPDKPAEALYRQLSQVGLDPTRVYQVRGASLNRSAIQISLDDGRIGFTQDVTGHITGAFFEGDGEILLSPPDAMERRSMTFFTGMAILEERFASAYFRFNDDAAAELAPDLRATDEKQEFVDRWDATAKNLAGSDAIRLLMTFSRMLPTGAGPASQAAVQAANGADRFLHARLQGVKLGVFDVFFDSTAPEQVQAGQAKELNGETYYDVWTSFSPRSVTAARPRLDTTPQPQSQRIRGSRISVRSYTIKAEVTPPKQIHARAQLQCEVLDGGERTLLFELSRFLPTESVTLDGRPVEFIHNPSIEGTQLSRRGNDVVAVVLPEPTRTGQQFQLEFGYGGEVLAEAGNGLLYVGARGTWYPNRGMEMADFDLQFTYPSDWTLVATGKPAEVSAEEKAKANGQQITRWTSDRPIPLAGFNLGKYREATTEAGKITVETYATRGVEKEFPNAQIQIIAPPRPPIDPTVRHPELIVAPRPSPVRNELRVGEEAAQAIEYFSERFGPFPYSHLALTQFPGRASQGWPGLVFLSSYAFLNDAERQQLHYDDRQILLQQLVPAHETAHQWWGDLVSWTSYRDQWFSEGLSQYCTLMMLQEKNPAGFHAVMADYRRELLKKDEEGVSPEDAGAVTLGTRLVSSRLPGSYEAITYGRGTWLFHMLRSMMKDAYRTEGKDHGIDNSEPFVRALRNLRQRYEGKAVSTQELLDVFAEELPPS
ncbi:MAG TPA: M1 family aminopeptidase, partial [Candidatus Sulfotelmatobacter sp.]|nr:M1 family aminopeptidase [Candidatus Sulfotelmatobacter sp.]